MTDQPIDPAATPDDDNAAQIAADDVGASAMAERAARDGENPILPDLVDDEEEGLAGDGV